AVSAALFAAGAEGVIEEGAALVTVFADHEVATAAERAARAADHKAETSRTAFEPEDWTVRWRNSVRVHDVGRFVIAPPWLANGDPRTIVIDPGLGFGTGEHETTRLALRMLSNVVRRGDVVADVGCGSGILSIACAKLGAARVTGIEIDTQAIRNAEENVDHNGVGATVGIVDGDASVLLPLLAPVRVIVANIVSSTLLELEPAFAQSLDADGDVIVGGVLRTERDAFVESLTARGWRVEHERDDGEWWGAHLRRSSQT
ncbi:MAG TPA: 50S ribosomal protein L11 methyltransferase, partial [Gemmatimonadaceae bacterium]|nr:50S ribosomal protein L11 methyltransferase [Gemmatimonadaceae bacterium]